MLNSLWVGKELGYLEVLCLKSALATGHQFSVYSYTPEVLKVPDGIELRDAAEVMPECRLLRYADTGSVALGANLWRYEMLAKGLGYWADMDFIFLKNLGSDREFDFGWEYTEWINNAVLLAPPHSAMVKDLREIPRDNQCPPWFGPKRTLEYYWRRLRQGKITVADMPWGTYSAGLVTYVVKRHGLTGFARSPDVYFPVPWADARTLFGPSQDVEKRITDATMAVHMWNSRLVGLFDKVPPEGSYIARMCDLHEIDAAAYLRHDQG